MTSPKPPERDANPRATDGQELRRPSESKRTRLALERLAELYAVERTALVRADAEVLVALQEEKATLVREVEALSLDEASRHALEELERKARENLMLMRHLSRLLGGIVGVRPITYGARGRMAVSSSAPSRGDRGMG